MDLENEEHKDKDAKGALQTINHELQRQEKLKTYKELNSKLNCRT